MIKNLTTRQRKAIKTHLVHGDIKRIAEKLSLSTSTIHSFFNGRSNNPAILAELLNLLKKHDENSTFFESRLPKKQSKKAQ